MDKNSFLIDLSESERTEHGRVDFPRQQEAQKVFSAIWELESEVNNGGFEQYFRNSDSSNIAFSLAALRAVGAHACARITDSAIEVVSPLPATEQERDKALDALNAAQQAKLDAADARFYEYPDDLTKLLFDYVAKHPETFGPVPD